MGELKGSKTGNRNPNFDAIKVAQMWGIGVDCAKKRITVTTQNSVWYVTKPLTKQFRTRQVMFRCQRFKEMTYTDTTISGVKCASGNRVAQVYVTDFGDVRIHPLAHRIEVHTSLS